MILSQIKEEAEEEPTATKVTPVGNLSTGIAQDLK